MKSWNLFLFLLHESKKPTEIYFGIVTSITRRDSMLSMCVLARRPQNIRAVITHIKSDKTAIRPDRTKSGIRSKEHKSMVTKRFLSSQILLFVNAFRNDSWTQWEKQGYSVLGHETTTSEAKSHQGKMWLESYFWPFRLTVIPFTPGRISPEGFPRGDGKTGSHPQREKTYITKRKDGNSFVSFQKWFWLLNGQSKFFIRGTFCQKFKLLLKPQPSHSREFLPSSNLFLVWYLGPLESTHV